jgi:hypothetical protein
MTYIKYKYPTTNPEPEKVPEIPETSIPAQEGASVAESQTEVAAEDMTEITDSGTPGEAETAAPKAPEDPIGKKLPAVKHFGKFLLSMLDEVESRFAFFVDYRQVDSVLERTREKLVLSCGDLELEVNDYLARAELREESMRAFIDGQWEVISAMDVKIPEGIAKEFEEAILFTVLPDELNWVIESRFSKMRAKIREFYHMSGGNQRRKAILGPDWFPGELIRDNQTKFAPIENEDYETWFNRIYPEASDELLEMGGISTINDAGSVETMEEPQGPAPETPAPEALKAEESNTKAPVESKDVPKPEAKTEPKKA